MLLLPLLPGIAGGAVGWALLPALMGELPVLVIHTRNLKQRRRTGQGAVGSQARVRVRVRRRPGRPYR